MFYIQLDKQIDVELKPMLEKIAAELELELIDEQEQGYRLLPSYILGIYGVTCERAEARWRFWRESDATTWEDFVLMHVTHRLAHELDSLLSYVWPSRVQMVEPTPDKFLTFDHYADFVVSKEDGLVRDMKKNWIYNHRKRFVR